MFHNKKALTLTLTMLVKILLTSLFFILIVFPACDKLSDVFFGKRDLELFDDFVNSINELKEGQKPVFLRLKGKNQAVVAFSKDSIEFQYVSATLHDLGDRQIIKSKFKKPARSECSDSACICFCGGDLKKEGKTVSCEIVDCRKLDNVDIIGSNLVFINPFIPTIGIKKREDLEYWKNGFLFGRSIKNIYSGLPEEKAERTVKVIEKRKIGNKIFLGVCDPKSYEDIEGDKEILEREKREVENKNYRQDYFGSMCIVTEYEEGMQFEELVKEVDKPFGKLLLLTKDDLYKNAIKKYEEFIAKYENAREAEDAMYRIASIYKEKLKDNENARKICEEFIKKYPNSEIKYKFQNLLEEMSGESMAAEE